jgi:hypothetical protein
MTTAADIIGDAFLIAGIGDQYNALDAASSAVGLRILNRMMDSWSNESLSVYNINEDTFTMTPGQYVYSTSLLTQRPREVDYVFVRQNNVDYQCDLISADNYSEIAYKITSGLPDQCYYNSGYPNGTLTFFPSPSTPYEAHIGYKALLETFANLTTAVSLPPGYERALVYNLALELAPAFGTQAPASVAQSAYEAKWAIKRMNYPLTEAQVNTPLGEGLFNIYRGS